jgi:hypothetical protein
VFSLCLKDTFFISNSSNLLILFSLFVFLQQIPMFFFEEILWDLFVWTPIKN